MLGLVLEEVAEHGTTVLISTHQLGDLERIADHVAVMIKGRCLLTRTVEDLRKEARKIQAVFPEGLPEAVRRMPGILHVESQGRVYTLTVGNGFDTVLEAVKAHRPVYVETVSLGLEEWFIRTVEKEGMKDGAVSAE
jgi:ABC-2 type transport system ATP-binding protein